MARGRPEVDEAGVQGNMKEQFYCILLIFGEISFE